MPALDHIMCKTNWMQCNHLPQSSPPQVEWLRERVQAIPVRLVFESALELMGSTQIGSFTMSSKPGERKGPPPVIQKV